MELLFCSEQMDGSMSDSIGAVDAITVPTASDDQICLSLPQTGVFQHRNRLVPEGYKVNSSVLSGQASNQWRDYLWITHL